MKTEAEIRAHLIQKAEADSAFRARLLSDTRKTVEQEFDVTVPEGFDLHVHEETTNSAHLVLPPVGGRLAPSELTSVSGGSPGTPMHAHETQMGTW